jgi:hypothetical protein
MPTACAASRRIARARDAPNDGGNVGLEVAREARADAQKRCEGFCAIMRRAVHARLAASVCQLRHSRLEDEAHLLAARASGALARSSARSESVRDAATVVAWRRVACMAPAHAAHHAQQQVLGQAGQARGVVCCLLLVRATTLAGLALARAWLRLAGGGARRRQARGLPRMHGHHSMAGGKRKW